MPSLRRLCPLAVASVALALCMATAVSAAVEVLDAYYRPDTALPQFNYLWNSGYKPGDVPPNYILSGAVCVYLRNAGSSAVTVSDVLLQGVSLTNAFGCKPDKTYRDGLAYACSIHYPSANPITSEQRQALIDAGEPIWWRADPDTLAPGQCAEVFVRMRVLRPQTLSLEVLFQGAPSVPLSTNVSSNQVPRVASYGLSPALNALYLYFRHPQRGKSPVQILLDGQDATATSTIGQDATMDVIPVVCSLASPMAEGSFHCVQAVYDDGTKASAGARLFQEDLHYGLWGGNNASTTAEARAYVENVGRHNINQQVQGATGMVNDFMKSPEGLALMDQYGIRRTNEDPDKAAGRLSAIFLCDEPDAGDTRVPTTICPTYAQLGALAQSLAYRGDSYHATHGAYPNILNLDSTFKPHNWYVYGQVADMFSADPYYQVRLADSYWTKPYQIPLYTRAYYIHGVASVCEAACEPRPLHIILNSTRMQNGEKVFRFATPEEKRIELYYALAGGAKHFSYWWYTPTSPTSTSSNGCGADEPSAAALWREIGLLGAEARTAGPAIVRSCPAQVPVSAPGELWVRTLLSGLDTLVLLCVNDDYANDRAGTAIRPVLDAHVSVTLPAWLTPSRVFEIDHRGVRDLPFDVAGGKLDLSLSRVDVTRLIVATSDPSLRDTLSALYQTKFAANVGQLVPL